MMREIKKEISVELNNVVSKFIPKIAEKTVWRSIFLTRRHRILSAD